MTHRLQDSTRLVAILTAGGAVVAAVDVLDRHGTTAWATTVAVVLLLAAVLVARLRRVSLEITDDVVVVRNVLSTHELATGDVAEVRAGSWRSLVVLADGTGIPTLLRDRDLVPDPADHPPVRVAAV